MKTTLKYTTLFMLAALTTAAAAETAGMHLATYVNGEAGISVFASLAALLTFGNDYRPRHQLEIGLRDRRRLQPADDAFSTGQAPLTQPRRARVRRTFRPTVTL